MSNYSIGYCKNKRKGKLYTEAWINYGTGSYTVVVEGHNTKLAYFKLKEELSTMASLVSSKLK